MTRLKWALLSIPLIPVIGIAGYLVLAFIGGLVPGTPARSASAAGPSQNTIYLTANMLHADIALPVNTLTRKHFGFLYDSGFPLGNPGLKYLVVGWGSQAFYTSTRDYADIEFATVWKAATGDASVMHVAPAGDVSKLEDVVSINLSDPSYSRLVKFIANQFRRRENKPVLLEGATFGFGDVFYLAKDRFHLFNPCNVWVSRALGEAGLGTGIWTPTTYSLLMSHRLFN